MSDITVEVTTQPAIDVSVSPLGATGPAGPSVVSADAGNTAILGTDNLIFVPEPTSGGAVDSVAGKTGVVVLTADDMTDGTTNHVFTAADDTKLGGIASGATANSSDATLLARANHTGTQSADTLTDGTTNKAFLATERTKLAGVATGATANSSDATLLARANHTGTQSADTLTDGTTNKAFLATERTKLAGIATGATANSADATLLARANHTGTQLAATISDFNTAADARVTAGITGKADLASPALTGNPTAPTASPGDNDTSIATTAFVTAAVAAASPATADYTKTTASLANNANESGTFTLSSAEVHDVLVVTADRAARVRFYATTTQRDADASRAIGTDPTGNHGLLLEVVLTSGILSYDTSPPAVLFNRSSIGSAVPVTITNTSGSTSTVLVTVKAKGL